MAFTHDHWYLLNHYTPLQRGENKNLSPHGHNSRYPAKKVRLYPILPCNIEYYPHEHAFDHEMRSSITHK